MAQLVSIFIYLLSLFSTASSYKMSLLINKTEYEICLFNTNNIQISYKAQTKK